MQKVVGSRYTTAEWSRTATEDSKGRDGVEMLDEQPFVDPRTQVVGFYTHKIYHFGGFVLFVIHL